MVKNNFAWGLLMCVAVTFFGLGLVYVWRYQPNNFTFMECLQDVKSNSNKASSILSLALLANIPLIYYFQKRKCYKTLKGIGLILAVIVVLILRAKFNLF